MDRSSKRNAGRLFFSGSLTRRCIQIAPNIRNPMAAEAGIARKGCQMEITNTMAEMTLRVPTMNIIALESPYTSNSSCMLSAFPPRHRVPLLALKNQTFTMPAKMINLANMTRSSKTILFHKVQKMQQISGRGFFKLHPTPYLYPNDECFPKRAGRVPQGLLF